MRRSCLAQLATVALALPAGALAVSAPVAAAKPAAANPLVGTAWWHYSANTAGGGDLQDNTGFYFVNANTVYSGLPSNGFPTHCQRRAINRSRAPDAQGACISYAYNKASGTVKIGGFTLRYAHGDLSAPGGSYARLTIEPAGTMLSGRFYQVQTVGSCEDSCTTVQTNFGLSPHGRFYLAAGSDSSSDSSSDTTWFTVFPHSETGTYKVNGNGSITLHYANGHTQVRMFAANGKNPAKAGVLLSGLIYLPSKR